MNDPKLHNFAAVLTLVAFVLLCILASSSYVTVVFDGLRSSSLQIDAYTAQVFWNRCEIELVNMNKAIEGIELCKHGEDKCGVENFNAESVRKASNYLHPSEKKLLRDCVMRINLQTVVRGDQYDIWYRKYLEQLVPLSYVPRRYLATGPAASPSPAPSPVVFDLPPSVPPAVPLPPAATGSSGQSAPTGVAPPSSNSGLYKSSSKQKSVAIAVGVTVPVTLIIAALLVLCYIKLCKGGAALRRNDKRPLLSLSLQELSDGPRQNSSFFPNPSNKDKRNGRVADQTNGVSSHNGDIYPNSHFISDINSQSSELSFSGWSVAKLSSDSHATSSSIAASDQKPLAPPGMVKIPPPAPRPPRATDASPTTRVESSLSHTPNVPNTTFPAPPVAKPASALPQTLPPPPPMVKPVIAAPKPPAPPQPIGSLSGSRPPPPPRPPGGTVSHHPPPPLGNGPPPLPPPAAPGPRPPPAAPGFRPPLGPGQIKSQDSESSATKPKLKPFFWDKVLANPDSSMVWNQIKSGSFQFDEDMIEALFGSAPVDKKKNELKNQSGAKDPPIQYIKLIDIKKAQNISILLKALNLTTEEVCDALLEGYELPTELFQTLLKMAPTQEEEMKLRMFDGDISHLGPAERFLRGLVDIPFAFQRIECLIFATSIQEEVSNTKQSFATLEVACKELRSSRLFFKLLEAVLKTGNRMNDGTFRGGAQAFKLDTLLKLSDVRGTDGKTTLLHFVVQEIIRSEGIRAARAARESNSSSSINLENASEVIVDDSEDHLRRLGLEVVSHLSSELENVKKAAALDADSLAISVAKLKNSLNKTRSFLETKGNSMDKESGFYRSIKNLVQNAEVDVSWLVEEEKRIMTLVKSTGSYFHGNAGKDEGLHLFSVVRDFLMMVDKVCKEVKNSQSKPVRTTRSASPSSTSSAVSDQVHHEPAAVVDMRQRLFPAITDRRVEPSDSDDET